MEHGEAARTEERKKEIKEKDGIREVRRGPEGLTIKTQLHGTHSPVRGEGIPSKD